MSIKSILAYSILLVLDFYIDVLLLVAYCLAFILEYLKDPPPVNNAFAVPTTEDKTSTVQDGAISENEPIVVGTTSTVPTDETSASPIPFAELQSRPPSPPGPALPSIQMPQHKMAAMPSARPSPTPDPPSIPTALAARTHPGRRSEHQTPGWDVFLDGFSRAANGSRTDLLRFLRESGILRNESDSSQGGSSDDLRTIVPCWDRDDVIGEESTCPIILCPGLNASQALVTEIVLRTMELRDKFESDENISWLKRACHIVDHALAVSHSNDEILGTVLLIQAGVRVQLFNATKDDPFLDQSIVGFRAGLALIPHNATGRHDWLQLMGSPLEQRHNLKGGREDLDQAIEAYREALALWPQDDEPPFNPIHRLGVTLQKRFEIGGDLSDLESAIHRFDGLLSMIDDDHPLRPDVLHDLGIALHMRCERRWSVDDMERAINLLEEYLSLQSHDSPNRPKALHNLATSFHTRYEMSGRVSDLDHAIRLYQRSLYLENDDPKTLNNLANALYKRYKRTDDAADLGQAILHLEKAVTLISNDDPSRLGFLGNMAAMLNDRHSVSNDVADVNKAINILEQILSLLPDNHSDRPSTLTNLFLGLFDRFKLLGNVSDRNNGFDYLTEALSLTPSDDPLRQIVLFNLLYARSFLLPPETLSTDELALFLDQCVELVKLTPQQHPDYSDAVTHLVPVLLTCHLRQLDSQQLLLAVGLDAESDDVDAVFVLLERGAKASTSPSTHRLQAICDWITLCRTLNHPPTLEMFTAMFDLLNLSIARSCSLETRHKQLSTSTILRAKGFVAEAVAFAIEQGVSETAVEFVERGQSTLLAQLSRYRSSSLLDVLHSVRPDLATRFRDLSWQVEHATFTGGQPLPGLNANHPLEDPISRSNRLKTDWDDVVQQIRALDGFHNFLRPTPFSILQQAAAEGPVILVNICNSRSDAIIVTSDQPPAVVPLPFATPEKVESLVSMFRAAPQSMSNSNAVNGLKGVWDTIVEPVVTELQDTLKLPKNSRIWWCPTNSAVSLPLHTAGIYRLKDNHLSLTRNCLPFLYISSYTSSLDALIRARRDRRHYSGLPSILLVGQPDTPGQAEIPQVREEICLIRERIPNSLVLMDDRGTHDAVLSALVQHQWVHLACHGHVKSDDPLGSHFALYDGPLPLLEIMRQRLPAAEFAFLSACHSASSDSDTPDEFLHLAAGMQFAGFKSVVGTMWAMADDAGPPLADDFYRRMLPVGGRIDHRMAARALHGATRKLLKDEFPLAIWINFVHWGA